MCLLEQSVIIYKDNVFEIQHAQRLAYSTRGGYWYRNISARRHNALPHSAKLLGMRKTAKWRCFPGQVHHARPHPSGYINALYLVLE